MAEEVTGLLPTAARKAFQQSLAKCQSCIDLTNYLAQLGMPEQETADRAEALKQRVEAALELDRQAKKQG